MPRRFMTAEEIGTTVPIPEAVKPLDLSRFTHVMRYDARLRPVFHTCPDADPKTCSPCRQKILRLSRPLFELVQEEIAGHALPR